MKLICFEIRKIFANKLVIIVLALLLAINGIVCVYYLTRTRHDLAEGSDVSEYAENYVTALDTVISEAAANLNQYDAQDIAVEDYVYQYQLRLIRTYSYLRDNVEFGTESTQGFDTFFGV